MQGVTVQAGVSADLQLRVTLDDGPAPQALMKAANRVAKRDRCHKSTAIVIGQVDQVVERVRCGYRKCTTGEYVSDAYRKKGWSNIYYQRAVAVVELSEATARPILLPSVSQEEVSA